MPRNGTGHKPINKCTFSFRIFSQGGPVEILPFLFLGSAFHASKKDMLDGMGISALLNVSSNCPNHFEGTYQYKCIPVEDNHKEDISSWFIEAIDFIGELGDAGFISRLSLFSEAISSVQINLAGLKWC